MDDIINKTSGCYVLYYNTRRKLLAFYLLTFYHIAVPSQ